MKKLILLLLACCLLLCGCGSADGIPTEDVELWVVTELTEDYGMNDQANRMIKAFADLYPNVTVRLDILPTGAEERAVYLEKIRTSIMAGEGPDVYLMPTSNFVPDRGSLVDMEEQVVPLFRDVSLSMYNGLFYDISEYYDADDTLGKDELNTPVMDAGVMDGCRYVIPLRYDIGVYLVDRGILEALGADISVFDGTIADVMALAAQLQSKQLSESAGPTNMEYYFSAFNDYQNGMVELTVEEVAEYMRLYQSTEALREWGLEDCYATSSMYIRHNIFFAAQGHPLYHTQLSSLLNCMATAKVLGEEIEMYPQRASDGSLNAVVRYYAAVGATTVYPKLSYEFVRLFLGVEAQHETYLATKYYAAATSNACIGWPVRNVGSVEARFTNLKFQLSESDFSAFDGAVTRARRYQSKKLTMTDTDLPAVFWEVDHAWLPITMENEDSLGIYCTQLLDDDFKPTDVDIDALARAYIDEMQLYLDEG